MINNQISYLPMIIRFQLLIVVLLSLIQHTYAQGDSTQLNPGSAKRLTHNIGVWGGFSSGAGLSYDEWSVDNDWLPVHTTGVGLSYRVWSSKWGGQASFSPIHTNDFEFYSAGLNWMYVLNQKGTNRFYFYQVNQFISHVRYHKSHISPAFSNGQAPIHVEFPARTEVNQYFNNGLGLGGELFDETLIFLPIGLSFQAGLSLHDRFSKINLSGEIALIFRLP